MSEKKGPQAPFEDKILPSKQSICEEFVLYETRLYKNVVVTSNRCIDFFFFHKSNGSRCMGCTTYSSCPHNRGDSLVEIFCQQRCMCSFHCLSLSLPPPQTLTILFHLFFFPLPTPSLRLTLRHIYFECSTAGEKAGSDGNRKRLLFHFATRSVPAFHSIHWVDELEGMAGDCDGVSWLSVIRGKRCSSVYVTTRPQCLFNTTWMVRSPWDACEGSVYDCMHMCVCVLLSL